jgi:hypothetical protein
MAFVPFFEKVEVDEPGNYSPYFIVVDSRCVRGFLRARGYPEETPVVQICLACGSWNWEKT